MREFLLHGVGDLLMNITGVIFFLAIVVGFIVISIVQPMFEMYDGISNL